MEGVHADGFAALRAHAGKKRPPQGGQGLAAGEEFRAHAAEMGAPQQLAGNPRDGRIHDGHLGQIRERDAAGLCNHGRGARPLDRATPHLAGPVFNLHLRANHVFLERRERLLAQGCMGKHQQTFRQRVHFNFGEDAALWVQQQRQRPPARRERLDVVRANRVQILDAVAPA